MKKIILIVLLSALFISCTPKNPSDSINPETPYRCVTDADCVSTCGMGCINADFAANYKDTCVNFRAFDCSCVKNECYTDGQPFVKK